MHSLRANVRLLEETKLLDVELDDDLVGAQRLDDRLVEVDQKVLLGLGANNPVTANGREADVEFTPGCFVALAGVRNPGHVVELRLHIK